MNRVCVPVIELGLQTGSERTRFPSFAARVDSSPARTLSLRLDKEVDFINVNLVKWQLENIESFRFSEFCL